MEDACDRTTHADRAAKAIRHELQTIGAKLRRQHPVLGHQDAIGLTICIVSCASILAGGWLYGLGMIPAWLTVISAALFMSLLHELEHDLIHHMYFKDNPLVQNAMLAAAWLLRPSTISPWVRRDLHLHHHKSSGLQSDMEERSITLGERFGVRRLLMMFDGMWSVLLRVPTFKELARSYADSQRPGSPAERQRILWRNRFSYLPVGLVHFVLWYSFLSLHACELGMQLLSGAGLDGLLSQSLRELNFLVVIWIGPNLLRSFCLNFVSSNLHYYGDVEPKNVIQQTQVWTSPWVLPFQLFCFNFGATHAIHHFVVREPFYVRQLMQKEAHRVLQAHGVRFNDFGTFLRANRWEHAL